MPSPAARRLLIPVALLGLLAATGCGPSDEVRTYTVPKAAQKDAAGSDQPDGPAKGRLIGAVVPAGEGQNWYVKFSGPVDAVTAHEKAVDEFIRSIRVTGGKPTWTAPPGWKEGPRRMMRVVTFIPPGEGKPPELYISDPLGGSLLANVNRWRKEIGLKDVTEADLPNVTTEAQFGDVKGYRLDYRGPKEPAAAGMGGMPPFMQKN